MDRAGKRFEEVAAKLAKGDLSASNVADLIVSEHAFQANAVVVRAQDEMIGTLLDVKR